MLASRPVMRRTGRALPAFVAVLAFALVVAPAAPANTFDTIFKAYQRTGKVDACRYSASDLKKALGQVPNDIEQYAPDFPAALQAAAEKRASGGCDKPTAGTTTQAAPAGGGPTATTGVPPGAGASPGAAPAAGGVPADGTPKPTPSSAPAASAADKAIGAAAVKHHDDGSGVPAALVALAVVLGLLAVGALAWALTRWLAWEPPWLVRARHAGAEAGWRASATWAEFTDWVRLGR